MTHTLHFQLLAAHTLFQRTFLKYIRRVYPDLLPGQPKVIDFLMRTPSACQREIADACLLEPPTLSLILRRMERAGLVIREKTPDNRKSSAVRLTSKGKQIGEKVLELFEETEQRLCRGLRKSECAALSRALRTIFDNARKEPENETQIQ